MVFGDAKETKGNLHRAWQVLFAKPWSDQESIWKDKDAGEA
jgi:hypothetical protein